MPRRSRSTFRGRWTPPRRRRRSAADAAARPVQAATPGLLGARRPPVAERGRRPEAPARATRGAESRARTAPRSVAEQRADAADGPEIRVVADREQRAAVLERLVDG